MDSVIVREKDDIVMRLMHYFITEKNYQPIVVRGVNDEIWLENSEGPYKIIRINSNYIHNDEQFDVDIFKIRNVMKQIKRKTFSLKMNTLNIVLDLNDNVKIHEYKDIDSISIKNVNEIANNVLAEIFPDIKDKLMKDEKGIQLIINATNDINNKTDKENRIYENIFKPKKIIVTNILITLCIVAFMALVYLGGNPLGFEGSLLYKYGANLKEAVIAGDYYRLLTAAFLHVSIFHLVFNMYALFILGNQLESYIGKIKFLVVYLVSAITGCLMSCIFSSTLSVGASGAIFGLLGSLLYFGYHFRLYLGSVLKNQIIPLLLINLLLGFMDSSIDNAAHIGGLIGGYLATMALGIKGKSSTSERVNGTIVLLIFIGFMIYILFR